MLQLWQGRPSQAGLLAPGGRKEGQGLKQKGKQKAKETVAVAKEKVEEKVEEAWSAMIDDEVSIEFNMPVLSYIDFAIDDLLEQQDSCLDFDEMEDLPDLLDNDNHSADFTDDETPCSAHYTVLHDNIFNSNIQEPTAYTTYSAT